MNHVPAKTPTKFFSSQTHKNTEEDTARAEFFLIFTELVSPSATK